MPCAKTLSCPYSMIYNKRPMEVKFRFLRLVFTTPYSISPHRCLFLCVPCDGVPLNCLGISRAELFPSQLPSPPSDSLFIFRFLLPQIFLNYLSVFSKLFSRLPPFWYIKFWGVCVCLCVCINCSEVRQSIVCRTVYEGQETVSKCKSNATLDVSHGKLWHLLSLLNIPTRSRAGPNFWCSL